MGEDQGRLADIGDDVGQGHGLAGTGDAEEGLVPGASPYAGSQLRDGAGLISSRNEWGDDFEFRAWHAGPT
jgi:hypothetical protein